MGLGKKVSLFLCRGKFGQNSIIPKICEIENCGKEFSCKQAYAGHVKSHKSRKIPPEVLQEMKSI